MTTKQALKQCQVFAALTDAELEKIASLAVEKRYEAGDIIFEQGDPAEGLFVVREGKIAVQKMQPEAHMQMGRSITVDLVTRDEMLDWSAIVEPYVHTSTAVCLQKATALSINGSKLERLLQDNQRIGHEVLKGLIKIVASSLDDTRHVLVSERLLTRLK